jgi:hypothetical protein
VFYFILSLAATCFGHLFGHLQAILESVYFLFTLLYLQYTYTYTTTTTVIRDLLLCFMGNLLSYGGPSGYWGWLLSSLYFYPPL